MEEALEANVTPVQVNPLSDTETQNHVELLTLTLQESITVQHIVSLRNTHQMLEYQHQSICLVFLNRDPNRLHSGLFNNS